MFTEEIVALWGALELTIIRKTELGKDNFSFSKVNQLLKMFGYVLVTVNENDFGTGN